MGAVTDMEKYTHAYETTYNYYVMNKVEGVWVKVSEDYPDVREAAQALGRLKEIYPQARLGGSRRPDRNAI
jgi:hypothetical protein